MKNNNKHLLTTICERINKLLEETTMMRKFFVGGNWKCNGDHAKIAALVKGLNDLKDLPDEHVCDVVVAPTFLHLGNVQITLNKRFVVAAQNCWTEAGAFTGEVAPEMLKDFGVNWVILGHSERRHVIGENDELLHKKLLSALKAGLNVIFCIGEREQERMNNDTMRVVETQLHHLFESKPALDWSRIVLAYEPVWAIGTGKTATPEIAQTTHADIRNLIKHRASADVADKVRILYGGSVKSNNCVALASCRDIDGFLVGGASLEVEQFGAIIRSANRTIKD